MTHDQIEAMTLATRIGVMDSGQLVQVGTPREIYTDPVNMYVASRLGMPAINFLPRSIFSDLNAPLTAKTIGLRTEHLKIAPSDPTSATGIVTWVEHLGDQDYLHINVQNHDVVTLSDPDSGLKTGDMVRLTPLLPLYFDVAGNRVRA